MKRIAVVTGAGGLIGRYVVKTAHRWAPEWEIRDVCHSDIDLTNFSAVDALWSRLSPDAVIHCAAMSRTKDCEQDPDRAHLVNVEVTRHLAALSRHVPFFFLSSGEVFDGSRGWYDESDEPNPINVYGRTKCEAEQIILGNRRHTVLRIVLTAGTSSSGNRSFVEDMCLTAEGGRDVRLYADEFRCPLPAGVIARVIWELVERKKPGLYHLGGRERLSRWEIAEALLPWYPELKGRLVKGWRRDHAGGPRPEDLSLRCDKISRVIASPIPGFREWLSNRTQRGPDLWDYLSP
ncbi:MAG TPA: SDR family oxidoreductase [Nitrospira sp.]